jgi:hypothetical protein
MSEKDFKNLRELAKEELRRVNEMSEQEARQKLVDTGIFNRDGSFTKPYRDLAEAKGKGH